MRLLIIEDEPPFIEKVDAALKQHGSGVELVTPTAAGLAATFDTASSLEEQMLERARSLQTQEKIDLVLLDSDLSRMGNGISQSLCRQAFQGVGLPVCRYKKKHSLTPAARLQDLHRLAREGASAVWVPSDLLQPARLATGLAPWLQAIEQGFAQLRQALTNNASLLTSSLGPAGILATALERPGLKADLLGYTAQNFFFFGPPVGEDEEDPTVAPSAAIQSTRLGYWLINYILAFPGPILSARAAAAYLNLQLASFESAPVRQLVQPARYQGPFQDVAEFYWRDDLAALLDESGGDVALLPALKHQALHRVDEADPGASAYLCVLTQEPITETDAAPNPDWIPPGAQLARIQSKLYDQLGPMLSI